MSEFSVILIYELHHIHNITYIINGGAQSYTRREVSNSYILILNNRDEWIISLNIIMLLIIDEKYSFGLEKKSFVFNKTKKSQ